MELTALDSEVAALSDSPFTVNAMANIENDLTPTVPFTIFEILDHETRAFHIGCSGTSYDG